MKLIRSFSVVFLLFSTFAFSAHAVNLSLYKVKMLDAPLWLEQEAGVAEAQLLRNISPAGTYPGTVIASPQMENPNYFRHWVRDAALTMRVVFKLMESPIKKISAKYFESLLVDYTFLSRQEQLSAALGEPIFEVSGLPFLGPWGRPQNDGPALRAIVLSQWAQRLLDQGEFDFVKKYLYANTLPANTVIKADLEYVSWNWTHPCFDLWEEVKAEHFYTKMVQRKALILGAQLARRLNDVAAAEWYEKQTTLLENSIRLHGSQPHQAIKASLNWQEGLNSKHSNLDVSVLLGVLHGLHDDFFKPSESMVLKTFSELEQVFSQIYPINQRHPQMATSFGRYPEDIYAGSNFDGGNPWVLATLAAAELSYRIAGEQAFHHKKNAEEWIKKGDSFVQRVQYHANPNGSLSEQIDRFSGYMSSARDLTWNYSAIVTTLWARKESKKLIKIQSTK